jgi:hypothetical protein
MMLLAGDLGYVCVVSIWLHDLLVVGGLWAAIGMQRAPASAICPAPGPCGVA